MSYINVLAKEIRIFNRSRAFTLVEVLVTLLILSILIGIAYPSFRSMVQQHQLSNVGQQLYDDLTLAQSLALKKRSTVHFGYVSGTNWCYGLSDSGVCNCNSPSTCTINGTQKTVSSASYSGTTLSVTGLASTDITFSGVRGVVTGGTGYIIFTNGSYSIQVQLNDIGNVLICSNNIQGYATCS